MNKAKGESFRLKFIQLAFAVGALLIIGKLFYIQVLLHGMYEAKAFDQHWYSQILTAKRGDILSRDGYPLATSKTYYQIIAEPNKISLPKDYARMVAPVLYVPNDKQSLAQFEAELTEKMTQKAYWVPLIDKQSEQKKDQVMALELKGIGYEEQPLRYYPEKGLASQVLGFVAGSDTGEQTGYFGIEGYFDGDLKGKNGKILEEKSASGEAILVGGYRKIPPQNGRTVVLTIDRAFQFLVETKLKSGVEKYGAESGSVVIVDPQKGDILAMANYPAFVPEVPGEAQVKESTASKSERKNISLEEVYEPGSIMKPLTVSSAVDLGLVTASTTFEDDGPKVYSGYTINNWNSKHLGVQTVAQLLEKSNNIGAAWVGTKVGAPRLYEYLRKFGLGELTGISLEGENTGTLRDPDKWEDIDLATVSFGQGISASVLQMAMAFSVFDNGGILMKPRIISEIKDNKRTIEFQPKQVRRVLSEATAAEMKKMLVDAVDNGESKYFNIKGYAIAGKTGTAQIPVNGKYDPSKSNATFVGFLPNAPDGKKFVMIVRLEKPSTSIYAAETAVPLWMDILRGLVLINKIPPDRN